MSLFEHVLPVAAATKPGDKDKKDDKKEDKGQTVRTQMTPENPSDDLGYDPDKIPVEPID